jgi:hypothetical protein
MATKKEAEPRIEMALARGSVLGIGTPGKVAIACLAGVLWVTAPETGDIILVAGDTTTLENRGRIVIEALETAEFDLETDARAVDRMRSLGAARARRAAPN